MWCIQCGDQCGLNRLKLGRAGFLCLDCVEVLGAEDGLLRRYLEEKGWLHEAWF